MKAMIFAAGLGTRLRPLTNDKPKAMVVAAGKPLLQIVIEQLKKHGFNDLIINVHHFADQVIDFIVDNDAFGINISISHEKDLLLETGGGLKNAQWFFDDQAFLVCNTDIISNIDLAKIYETHLKTDAIATLAVRQRKSSRYLLFDENQCLGGWRNDKTGARIIARKREHLQDWAFSGIQVMSPKIFDFFPKDKTVFSIIKTYLRVAATETIKAYPHDEDFWLDVGKIPELERAGEYIKKSYKIR